MNLLHSRASPRASPCSLPHPRGPGGLTASARSEMKVPAARLPESRRERRACDPHSMYAARPKGLGLLLRPGFICSPSLPSFAHRSRSRSEPCPEDTGTASRIRESLRTSRRCTDLQRVEAYESPFGGSGRQLRQGSSLVAAGRKRPEVPVKIALISRCSSRIRSAEGTGAGRSPGIWLPGGSRRPSNGASWRGRRVGVLRRAESAARFEKLEGGLWHAYRRK